MKTGIVLGSEIFPLLLILIMVVQVLWKVNVLFRANFFYLADVTSPDPCICTSRFLGLGYCSYGYNIVAHKGFHPRKFLLMHDVNPNSSLCPLMHQSLVVVLG